MTVVSGANFVGVATPECKPRSMLLNAQIDNIAADNGYIYEKLTGKKSDASGGSPTVAGHNHSEEGNLLYWPLATQQFGDGGGASSVDGFESYWDAPRIVSETAHTASAGRTLFYFPIFIPRGWSGKKFHFIMEYAGTASTPDAFLTLQTWGASSPPADAVLTTATNVSGNVDIGFERASVENDFFDGLFNVVQDDPNNFVVATFTPATTGLHTVKVTFDIKAENLVRQFKSYTIMPAIPHGQLNKALPGKPQSQVAANTVTVGDPHSTLTYDIVPVDSALTAGDMNIGPAVMMNQANSAVLEEWATGLPCGGNKTLTVSAGHVHGKSGSAPYTGDPIEYCVAAWGFGGPNWDYPTSAAAHPAIRTSAMAPGVGTVGLDVVPATYYTSHRFRLRTPIYTNATAGNLYAAVLICHDKGKGTEITVKIKSNSATTTVDYTSNNTADVELITNDDKHSFVSGGLTDFEIQIAKSIQTTSSYPQILGVCFYFDY